LVFFVVEAIFLEIPVFDVVLYLDVVLFVVFFFVALF